MSRRWLSQVFSGFLRKAIMQDCFPIGFEVGEGHLGWSDSSDAQVAQQAPGCGRDDRAAGRSGSAVPSRQQRVHARPGHHRPHQRQRLAQKRAGRCIQRPRDRPWAAGDTFSSRRRSAARIRWIYRQGRPMTRATVFTAERTSAF